MLHLTRGARVLTNLTIAIDEDILKRARMRALERGTSVNALLRVYLVAFAGGDARADATRALLEASRRAKSRRGKARWSRADLHER